MGIDAGAKLTAANFNAAFMCRNEDTDTIGRVKAKYLCTEKTTETAAATMDLATDTGLVEITGTGPVDITSFTSTIQNGQQVTIINSTDGDISFSAITGKTVTLPAGCSLFLVGCNGTLVPHIAGGGGGGDTKWVDGSDVTEDAVYTDVGSVGIGTAIPVKKLHVVGDSVTADPVQIETIQLDNSLEQFLVQDANGCIKYRELPTFAAQVDHVVIEDRKSSGTHGGSSSASNWIQRDLNWISALPGWVNIAGPGSFILEPGTYRIDVRAPAFTCLRNRIRLLENGADVHYSQNAYAKNGGSTEEMSVAHLVHTAEITTQSTYIIQHNCTLTVATVGLGLSNGSALGPHETYTVVDILKLA